MGNHTIQLFGKAVLTNCSDTTPSIGNTLTCKIRYLLAKHHSIPLEVQNSIPQRTHTRWIKFLADNSHTGTNPTKSIFWCVQRNLVLMKRCWLESPPEFGIWPLWLWLVTVFIFKSSSDSNLVCYKLTDTEHIHPTTCWMFGVTGCKSLRHVSYCYLHLTCSQLPGIMRTEGLGRERSFKTLHICSMYPSTSHLDPQVHLTPVTSLDLTNPRKSNHHLLLLFSLWQLSR